MEGQAIEAAALTSRKLADLDVKLEVYEGLIGEYPVSLQELIDGPSDTQLQKKWEQALAEEKEFIDGWGQPFVYERESAGAKPPYQLYSVGKPK